MMPTSKAAQRRRRATMSMMEAMRAMMAEAKRVKAEAAAAEAAAEASSSSGAQDAGSDVSEDAAHRPWTRASTAPARRRRERAPLQDATAASTLGHAIVYLHAGGYFQARHARLFAKIERDAGRAPASWTCCDRDEALRVRCIEHHTYGAGSGLLMANHRDNDSPQPHDSARATPSSSSEKLHNIETVTSGVRTALVVELWRDKTNAKDRFQ
ncbi:hypothetical protein JL720_15118 [Aureococcus anophagefferens]|nr:hypothetical protein JL720_15118 [Aureococcus anophagefferens]